jgi:hypothetical protein
MGNTFTNFYPTLWSDDAYFQFSQESIATRVCNMTWADPEGPSEAVRIPVVAYSESAIKDLAVLSNTPDDVTEASLIMQYDREKGFYFLIKYVEQDKCPLDLIAASARQRTIALANVVDKDVFLQFHNAANDLSGPVNKANLVSAITILNGHNAPQNDRILLVSPDGYSDLLNEAEFVRNDAVAGSQANLTGVVGRVLGLDVFMTNNLQTASGIDAVVLHRAAVAMAMLQRVDVRVFDEPRYFGTSCTGRATWGSKTIDANLMVTIDRA